MTDKSTKTKKPKLELVTDNEIHEKLLTGDGNRPAIDNERKDILNADIDCVCREIKSIQLTQSDYLPDGEQRNADWQHGFNSGCLGILREISARQFSEENPDEELDYYFPDLDS